MSQSDQRTSWSVWNVNKILLLKYIAWTVMCRKCMARAMPTPIECHACSAIGLLTSPSDFIESVYSMHVGMIGNANKWCQLDTALTWLSGTQGGSSSWKGLVSFSSTLTIRSPLLLLTNFFPEFAIMPFLFKLNLRSREWHFAHQLTFAKFSTIFIDSVASYTLKSWTSSFLGAIWNPHWNTMQPLRGVEWVHGLFLFPFVLVKMKLPHAKLGLFLCSLDNLLQKNVIVLFFGN